MPRRTPAQIAAELDSQAHQRVLAKARKALLVILESLRSMFDTMDSNLNSSIFALQSELTRLVGDDLAYQQAAAELWLEAQGAVVDLE